jgi:formylglycine-generating enzyme required for sulfatase activity/uncharacterized caspase-like protein
MRLLILLAIVVAGLLTPVGGVGQPAPKSEPGRYHALVVGNAAYSRLVKLETPVADANAVAEALRRRYDFSVEVLTDATREQIVTALNRLRADLSERDSLLIYYAGHGYVDTTTDTGFWLPVNAEPDNEANWISVSEVTRNLRANSARHILVVADSCYSGTLTRAAVVKVPGNADAWLDRMATKRSRTALTSGGIEPVVDGGATGHSVFARAMLDALEANDELMAGETLFARLRGPVVVKASQTPQYADIRSAGHDGGDFIFRPRREPSPAVAAAAGAPAADRALERDFWNAIKDSSDPAMFEAHILQFPDGFLTPLARLKVKELSERRSSQRPPEIAVVAPPLAAKGPTIADMEVLYDVVGAVTIREEPSSAAKRLGRLEKGANVLVTGKLADANWYRVETTDGGIGYVFGENIRQVARREPSGTAAVAPPLASSPTAAPSPPAPAASAPSSSAPSSPSPSAEAGKPAQLAIAPIAPPAAAPARTPDRFRDCDACPEMVRLPRGSFTMGANDGDASERPAHRVTLAQPLALGRYPVTVGEWTACVGAGSCKPLSGGDLANDVPAHNLSWDDATAYVGWLTRLTGRPYRLPSEAEWEYAARAGSATRYWWGDAIGVGKADCRGCGGAWSSARPAPVGSFEANPFGLHGMNGGVAQWAADCWYPTHAGAPADGAARGGTCSRRVLRGGAWRNDPSYLRSSSRIDYDAGVRYVANGLRVARSLTD